MFAFAKVVECDGYVMRAASTQVCKAQGPLLLRRAGGQPRPGDLVMVVGVGFLGGGGGALSRSVGELASAWEDVGG